MEVHHHPKLDHKPWKEYFLEGLMIFITVSMGFIAENISAHISDKKKEKQLINNLRKNLINDTVILHDISNHYLSIHNA